MELKIIATDLGFAEGPLWHKDGYLIFSDVANNRIMKVEDGKVEVFLDKSGLNGDITCDHFPEQIGSNGITQDKDGNLVFCQSGNHAIAKLSPDGHLETLVDDYQGTRLNSPNDLCIGPDGSIYFTDPPYGLKDQELQPDVALPFAGLYQLKHGQLHLLVKELDYPNGVCFSPDYKYLYLGTNKDSERGIRKFEVRNGELLNPEIFVDENADGMKTDSKGNLFLATMQGIKVVSPEGEVIRKIETPDMATNLCMNENFLYITTPNKVYEYYLPNLDL